MYDTTNINDLYKLWRTAPEWANWLAMDENSEWYWLDGEEKPKMSNNRFDEGIWQIARMYMYKEIENVKPVDDWKASLQQRLKCPYCNINEKYQESDANLPYEFKGKCSPDVVIEEKDYDYFIRAESEGCCVIKINFCPICGREL